MIYLSQHYPAWSGAFLGSSKLKVGDKGCTTTCISMLSDYFGCYQSPLQIANNAHNYTPEGLIIWNNLSFSKMKFVWREYGRNDAKIQDSIKDPKKAVILQVSNGTHWVVAISKNLIGGDYTVLDPWTGKKCNALATYHNITGSAHFVKA